MIRSRISSPKIFGKLGNSENLGRLRGVIAYSMGPVLGLLSGPILARSLGPDGRGQFAAIMQPISVASAVASVGIPTAVTYFIAKKFDRKRTLKLGLLLCAPISTITYLVMAWYATVVSANQGVNLVLLWFTWSAVIASAFVQILRAYWQGVGNWRKLDWERGLFAVLRFVAVCGVAIAGITVAGPYAIASLTAFVIAAALLYVPRRSLTKEVEVSPSVRAVWKYSASASIGTVAVVASSRLDQVVLPAATTSVELGYYAVAVTVAEVPVVFGTLAARNLLQTSASGKSLRESFLDVRLYLVAGVLSCGAAALLSPSIVPLVFGEDFRESVLSVQILAISSVYTILTVSAISLIAGKGHPLVSSLIPLTGAVLTAVLFWWEWEEMSSIVAAKISLISQLGTLFVATIAICWIWKKRANQ
ncbi:oligosaccharide flippase family protein [Rhodococcus sp. NPDC076796]|uniref:oligosaccharide flippase family protein n=1 Tax=Rhodococcus sp. NPDC076796 TaxID=3154859 RepID=UPI00344EA48A